MGNPVALVTGASIGIGRAFALALARKGYDIVAVARTEHQLRSLAEEAITDVEVLVADLADREQLALVEDRARTVDLVVNNAGFGTTGRFWELPLEREQAEIEVNVVALVRLSHAALPGMVERGRKGSGIINVSSIASFQPTAGNATYGATKAFVTSFTQALHEELRGTGVVATVVCPGATRTEWQARAGYDQSSLPAFAWKQPEEVVAGAIAAFERGRAFYVPGPLNKALAGATHLAPRAVVRRVAALVSRQV